MIFEQHLLTLPVLCVAILIRAHPVAMGNGHYGHPVGPQGMYNVASATPSSVPAAGFGFPYGGVGYPGAHHGYGHGFGGAYAPTATQGPYAAKQ